MCSTWAGRLCGWPVLLRAACVRSSPSSSPPVGAPIASFCGPYQHFFSFCHTVPLIASYGYVLDFLYRLLIFFSPKGFFSTKFFSKLRHLSHACRVPFDYSWDWHVQESVIYARTTHIGFRSAAQLYVGSTGQTVYRRELARRRKLIQLSRDRVAYYEPALHHQGNFYQGICIVLQQSPSTEHRLAFESSLIRIYQLNAPWV